MNYNTPVNDSKGIRAKTYRGTVATKDDASLLSLKENIKKLNAVARKRNKDIMEEALQNGGKLYRYSREQNGWVLTNANVEHFKPTYNVRVMPRGPRQAIKEQARAKGYICDLRIYLPQEFATHFDVYVSKIHNEREGYVHKLREISKNNIISNAIKSLKALGNR